MKTRRRLYPLALAGVAALAAVPAAAQFTAPAVGVDAQAVLRRIQHEATQNSQLRPLAQALLDSIGHRLSGSPGQLAAHDWAVARYREWGIEARNEQYGTWRGWRRGVTHADLLQPRVHSLDASMLPWSPPSNGPVTAGVVVLPAAATRAEFEAWLPQVAGKFVMVSFAQPTCRPDEAFARHAMPATLERLRADRSAGMAGWMARVQASGSTPLDLPLRLEAAGAAGILTSNWGGGWGAEKFHVQARTERVPMLTLGCEDYGMLFRLAENGQWPVLRVNAEAEFLGEQPALNTIAEIRGRELPDEYVVLSAHFDSWDGHSGATDNGTGTVTMMDAMRILRLVYPNPRRTILAGHWGGEEQGLNGSRAFVHDNPRVVQSVHVLFNQDNGTGRIQRIGMEGFAGAADRFTRWLDDLPPELADTIALVSPGTPSPGSSDHASFVCAGAPAFFLLSHDWDYGVYTWHTNRDSYDKLVWDDLKRNVMLIAMLAVLASEDETPFPRERITEMPVNPRTGERVAWPGCRDATRATPQAQW
jgi:carboxypeptidase Q